MTAQTHAGDGPAMQRTFTVRAALPPANAEAFDAELGAITHAPVVDLAALDNFLTSWWRIATRAARDPDDWQLMHAEVEQLETGRCQAGVSLAEVLARRGIQT